jgi:hypothetical protein
LYAGQRIFVVRREDYVYLVPFVEDPHTVFLKTIIPSRKAKKQTSVRSLTMKLDADEKELLESVERGEWKPGDGGKRERTRYSRYARAAFRKDRRLNIRLSPEARTRRGSAVSDADLERAAQVCVWAP